MRNIALIGQANMAEVSSERPEASAPLRIKLTVRLGPQDRQGAPEPAGEGAEEEAEAGPVGSVRFRLGGGGEAEEAAAGQPLRFSREAATLYQLERAEQELRQALRRQRRAGGDDDGDDDDGDEGDGRDDEDYDDDDEKEQPESEASDWEEPARRPRAKRRRKAAASAPQQAPGGLKVRLQTGAAAAAAAAAGPAPAQKPAAQKPAAQKPAAQKPAAAPRAPPAKDVRARIMQIMGKRR